jgi:hypothetical protein
MRYIFFLLFLFAVSCDAPPSEVEMSNVPTEGPISLHPENPHYFLYKGQCLALITSAEHYGAVINQDFNYVHYLRALQTAGMNYTRIFTGTYFEIPGQSFAISDNTLAPAFGRYLAPWQLSDDSIRYDFTRFNPAYFERLHDFLQLAKEYDIIVEVTLFSAIYRDEHWDINPQNPKNNVNVKGAITRFDAHTTNNKDLFDYQALLVRKIVEELNEYDNFFFEIQNEPWADKGIAVYNTVNRIEPGTDWTVKADFANPAAMAWQDQIAEVIVETEAKLPKKHLIAQNYSNFKAPIPEVGPHISIINFHYAWPEAVTWNYHYDKVIGFDESGFAGNEDYVYRRQAWQFMLSGGGLFNNLDYSFTVGQEYGTAKNDAPGGGSTELRRELRILHDFLHGFPLEKMHPRASLVHSAPGVLTNVLFDGNKNVAIFAQKVGVVKSKITLNLPDGDYEAQFLDTLTGVYSDIQKLKSKDGYLEIELNLTNGEQAIKVLKSE